MKYSNKNYCGAVLNANERCLSPNTKKKCGKKYTGIELN